MDDFLYAEPQRVPEPAALALLLFGLTLIPLVTSRSRSRTDRTLNSVVLRRLLFNRGEHAPGRS